MPWGNIKRLILPAAVAAGAPTAAYTAPAGANAQAQVTRVKLHNSTSAPITVQLNHNSATLRPMFNVSVQPFDTLDVTDEWQLNAGEAIFAGATASGVIISISGREYTE